jgi:hypothetical protein
MKPEEKIAVLEKTVAKLTDELAFALIQVLKLARNRDEDDQFRESDFHRIEQAVQGLHELADRIR